MTEQVNEALREHVTRVGFQLTLTKTQMQVLAFLVCNGERTIHYDRGIRLWVQGMRGLEDRGLLVWLPSRPLTVIATYLEPHEMPPDEERHLGQWWIGQPLYKCFHLTKAGEAVVSLLREAGLIDEPTRIRDRIEV